MLFNWSFLLRIIIAGAVMKKLNIIAQGQETDSSYEENSLSNYLILHINKYNCLRIRFDSEAFKYLTC